jgi:hypothetical protein
LRKKLAFLVLLACQVSLALAGAVERFSWWDGP